MTLPKKFETYKSLSDNKYGNYLDILSIEILDTLQDMYRIPMKYKEYKLFIKSTQELNIFFSEIKDLIWMKFCNQIRDFSYLIFNLLENKKYSEIREYIKKTSFLSSFLLDFKKYSALSLTLHNFNKHLYGSRRFKQSFDIYKTFNDAILAHENHFDNIKTEFEKIIFMFRKEDGYDICHTSLCLNNWSKIFDLFDYLVKSSNQKSHP